MYTTVLLPPAGKRQRQALMAADSGSTNSGRLFITDRVSNLRFLVDTGSDLCVVPRKLVPGCKEHTNSDLFAANHTPIPSYGWHILMLNLGLRRDFTWRFVVADVQPPIIGVDLLANVLLLVDCHNRILDGVTSLSTSAQTATTQFPSVKTIWSSPPADDPFAEFLDLTRPSEVPWEVRQNTIHIKTITGPSVSCRPRRLAPDQLMIAKAEFDAMLRDGTARRTGGPWSSALHLVPKKDNGWRPCDVYKALNARTIKDC